MTNRITRSLTMLGAALGVALLASCATTLPRGERHRFTMLGWLVWSDPRLVPAHPSIVADRDTAVLVRDDTTNALSLTIGPAADAKRLSSHTVASFQFVLRFRNEGGCASIGKVVLPLDVSNQIALDGYTGGDDITLTLSGTRLGRDLLLASLFAPGGLNGFVECGGRTVWLRGRADDPRSAYGSVWHRRAGARSQIYITSQVEYPIRLYRVEVDAGDERRVFSGQAVVAPWRSAVFDVPDGFRADGRWSIAVQGTPEITVPVTYRQYQGEHP